MRRALLLVLLIGTALAQDVILPIEVLDPAAQCQIYNGTACPSLVGLSVYSNSTFPLAVTEVVAGELIASVVPLSIQFPLCARSLQHLLCASLLPLCEAFVRSNGSALAIPRLPCESYCAEVNLECADAFRVTQQTSIVCAPNITYADAGNFLSPPCIADADLGAASVCLPLEETSIDGICTLPCPFPIYPLNYYDRLHRAVSALSWTGFFLLALQLALIAVDPTRRHKMPSSAFLYLVFCCMLLEFSLTFGSWVGWKDLQCEHSHLCQAQAIILSLGCLWAAAWLVVISGFAVLCLERSAWAEWLQRHWYLPHGYAWSYGIIFTCIHPTQYGPLLPSVLCSRNIVPQNYYEKYFTIPLLVQAGIVSVFVILFLIRLAMSLFSNVRATVISPAFSRVLLRSIAASIGFVAPAVTFSIMLEVKIPSIRRDVLASFFRSQPRLTDTWPYNATLTILSVLLPMLTCFPFFLACRNLEVLKLLLQGRWKDLQAESSSSKQLTSGSVAWDNSKAEL